MRAKIPFEDVPLIGFDDKIMVSTDENIIEKRCGAHFVGHNIGHGTYFQDYFEEQINQHTYGEYNDTIQKRRKRAKV